MAMLSSKTNCNNNLKGDLLSAFKYKFDQIRLDGNFVVDREDALGESLKSFDRLIMCHFTRFEIGGE